MARLSPQPLNDYYSGLVERLVSSYRHWTGQQLLPPGANRGEQARILFFAPFVVLAHGADPDPLFNYGNAAALQLFELSWDDLIRLPSRKSAEPMDRRSRAELLARVHRDGFIDDYAGVRVSATGRRFEIRNALVWNLLDDTGALCGQAARFSDWSYL